jgi:hypothetical protein
MVEILYFPQSHQLAAERVVVIILIAMLLILVTVLLVDQVVAQPLISPE